LDEEGVHDIGIIRLDRRVLNSAGYRERAYNAMWKRESRGDDLTQLELNIPTTNVQKADSKIYDYLENVEMVCKYGMTSEYTEALMQSYDGKIIVINVTSANTPFAKKGDSGSALVVKRTGEVLGLIYTVEVEISRRTFAHPIVQELKVFGATFVRTLSLLSSSEDEVCITNNEFDYESLKPNTKMLLKIKDALPELDYLKKILGVEMISSGMKITNGEHTRQPALIIYVTKKYSEEQLRGMGGEILPKYVDSSYGRFPTDIIEF